MNLPFVAAGAAPSTCPTPEPVPATGSYCSMQQAGPIPSPNFPMYYPSAADLGGVGIMSVMACPAVAV